MNGAVLFDAELSVRHLTAEPMTCPRGVADRVPPYPNASPDLGTLHRVRRCGLQPGHDGECVPGLPPRSLCGRNGDLLLAWDDVDDLPVCAGCEARL